MVALVAPSGAGKSTVFSLLMRLYDVAGGKISIDGHSTRDVTMASLRRNLSLVSQDAFLFGTSIRENIALGRQGATFEEVEAAAKAAACDFIDALPRSPVGKVLKKDLRARYWQGVSRQI